MIVRTKLIDTYYGAPLTVEWECRAPEKCSDDYCYCDPDLDGPTDAEFFARYPAWMD